MPKIIGVTYPANLSDTDIVPESWVDAVTDSITSIDSGAGRSIVVAAEDTIINVVNSTAVTTIFDYTIPGGSLGSGGVAYKWETWFTLLNNTGGNVDMTAIVYYGSTAIYTHNLKPSSTTLRQVLKFEGILRANASASAQSALGFWNPVVSTYFVNYQTWKYGTAAETSTSDLNLKMTFQMGTASANADFNHFWTNIYKMQT